MAIGDLSFAVILSASIKVYRGVNIISKPLSIDPRATPLVTVSTTGAQRRPPRQHLFRQHLFRTLADCGELSPGPRRDRSPMNLQYKRIASIFSQDLITQVALLGGK